MKFRQLVRSTGLCYLTIDYDVYRTDGVILAKGALTKCALEQN